MTIQIVDPDPDISISWESGYSIGLSKAKMQLDRHVVIDQQVRLYAFSWHIKLGPQWIYKALMQVYRLKANK